MDVRSRRVISTHAGGGEAIRNFLEWGVGTLGGDHHSGVVGLAAAVSTLAVAFFFGFPPAVLVYAVELDSGFLGLVIFLLAVSLDCVGASETG